MFVWVCVCGCFVIMCCVYTVCLAGRSDCVYNALRTPPRSVDGWWYSLAERKQASKQTRNQNTEAKMQAGKGNTLAKKMKAEK